MTTCALIREAVFMFFGKQVNDNRAFLYNIGGAFLPDVMKVTYIAWKILKMKKQKISCYLIACLALFQCLAFTVQAQKKKIGVLIMLPDTLTHYDDAQAEPRINKVPAKTNFNELVKVKLEDVLRSTGLSETHEFSFINSSAQEEKLGFGSTFIDKRNGSEWLKAQAANGYEVILQLVLGNWWDAVYVSGRQYPGMGILTTKATFDKPSKGLSVIYVTLRANLIGTTSMKAKYYDTSNEPHGGIDYKKPMSVDNTTYKLRPDFVETTPIGRTISLTPEKIEEIEVMLKSLFTGQVEKLLDKKKIEKDLLKI
jgi:hypothetical protein